MLLCRLWDEGEGDAGGIGDDGKVGDCIGLEYAREMGEDVMEMGSAGTSPGPVPRLLRMISSKSSVFSIFTVFGGLPPSQYESESDKAACSTRCLRHSAEVMIRVFFLACTDERGYGDVLSLMLRTSESGSGRLTLRVLPRRLLLGLGVAKCGLLTSISESESAMTLRSLSLVRINARSRGRFERILASVGGLTNIL